MPTPSLPYPWHLCDTGGERWPGRCPQQHPLCSDDESPLFSPGCLLVQSNALLQGPGGLWGRCAGRDPGARVQPLRLRSWKVGGCRQPREGSVAEVKGRGP